MKLLHPFMPFLSEELWHLLRDRKEGEDLIIGTWPNSGEGDVKLEAEMQHAFDLVTALRNVRNERGMSPKEALEVEALGTGTLREAAVLVVKKLANITELRSVQQARSGSVVFLVGTAEYGVDLGGTLDAEAEVRKAEEELAYLRGFLAGVDKKLSNERFVSGAPPQVLENERKKKADAEAKIKALEMRIGQLAG